MTSDIFHGSLVSFQNNDLYVLSAYRTNLPGYDYSGTLL